MTPTTLLEPATAGAADAAAAPEPLSDPHGLRIALVTETWPPEVNGVAATASRMASGLQARGHRLQLIRPRQSAQDRADEGNQPSQPPPLLVRGMPLPRYPELKMGLPARRQLLQLWRAQRPDLVHVITEGPLGWSALLAARQLGVPVVSDFRTNFHAYSRHYGAAWLRRPITAVLRHFHNRSAYTMVPTHALRAELAAQGFERLRVVARGVDTRRFDPARRSDALRASWGAGPHTMVALCVGRLAAEKNLQAVVAAAEAMWGDDPQMKLVFVGDGPERSRLAKACPRALFAGLRHGDDLAVHYASADVFLFASTTETFGNVVPEAMASGLAVVAFDHAAAGQLVRHGENGMLARCGHGASVSAGGDRADFCRIARRVSGELAWVRQMGENGRADALRLDWSHIVEAVEATYALALNEAG